MVSRMKLFLLKQKEEPEGSMYDKAQGFVIAAKHTTQARKLASQNCSDEGPEYWLDHTKSKISCIAESSKYQGPRIVIKETLDG